MSLVEARKGASALPILIYICLGHFFVDFMLGIWPVFKTMTGLNLAIAGILAGTSVFIGEGLQIFFGSLCDRGYQRLLLLCGISIAAAATCFSYTQSYVAFSLLFIATCIGSAAFHPTAVSILSNVAGENRSRIMGFFTAAGATGLGISQLIFSWTYDNFAGSTGILALPSILLAIATYFFLKGKTSPATVLEKTHSLTLFKKFFKLRPLRFLYLSMLGNQIALWSLVFLLPDLLKDRSYPAWIVFGGGHLFLMAGSTIGPPLLGHLADKTTSRQVIICTSLVTLATFYVLLAPLQLSHEALFAILFLLGAFLGSIPPLIWALGPQMVPKHRGSVSAFLMGFVWIVSESVGIGLSGFFATLFTYDAAAWSLAIMGSVQLLSCYSNFQIPKRIEEPLIA